MKYISFLFLLLFISSCNKDKEVTADIFPSPVITIDSETGIYTVKIGRELTISPAYQYVKDALYAWTVNGKLVSTSPEFVHTFSDHGETYVKIRVDTKFGSAEEELKVEIKELTPPVLSLVIPSQGLKVLRNTDYTLVPDIQHDDMEGFSIEWLLDNKVVSTQKAYTFHAKEPGSYLLTIKASNTDGTTLKELPLEVVETMPYTVSFPTPSYFQTSTNRYTFAGRPVYLKVRLEYFDYPEFEWSVNGTVVEGQNNQTYKFTPQTAGEYLVSLTVSEGKKEEKTVSKNIIRNTSSVTAEVKVICENKTEKERYRVATAWSSPLSDQVYEFLPAPGQYVNETRVQTGYTGNEITHQAAIRYADARIKNKQFVSLGTFGGYIIVGFDHSIVKSTNDFDFAIQGNAFDGSSEPGVIWVMQDVNGNGLPDDEWFELKGSETGKPGTIQQLEVTYFRPAGKAMNTPWITSEGKSGWVDYLASFHTQDYYYPLWVKEDSYTLTGTCLSPKNVQSSETGYWKNQEYDWGYADNYGNDRLTGGNTVDGEGQRNGFKIANAIYPDGTPVDLQYIDFIKVQCGVLAKSGWLGEISTEVFSFQDLSVTTNQ